MTPDAASRGALVARLLMVAAVFGVVHFLTLAGNIRIAVAVFLCAMVLGPGITNPRRLWRSRRVGIFMIAAVALAVAVIFAWPAGGTQAVLLAPPFFASMVTSMFFAHSLLPGEDPVITRMCRFNRGEILPDGLEEYSRLLTWGWAILPAFLAFAGLIAYAVAGLEAWSWITNVVSPLALVAFFVGEHVFRGIAYPHLGKPSLLHTFDVMFKSMSLRR